MKPVKFVTVLFTVVAFVVHCDSVGQAPGDEDQECLTDRPANMRILMASYNYVDLLETNGGPWAVVDRDTNNDVLAGNSTPTWVQSTGSSCSQEPFVCGYQSGPQDNLLITQYVNCTSARQSSVYVRITHLINSVCFETAECGRMLNVGVLWSNDANQSHVRNVSRFGIDLPIFNPIGGGKIVVYYTIPMIPFVQGVYLAFRDTFGTCISLVDVVVFYLICDAVSLELGANFTSDQYPGQSSSGYCFANMAIDLANPNGSFQATCVSDTRAYIAGWSIPGNVSECMCLPGYYYISRSTVDQCRACPSYTFKHTLSNTDVCQPCPLFSNSTAFGVGLAECPCDPGYYRTESEAALPCTRPPSAPQNLKASNTTNTSVFLQWDSVLDDGNRTDVFYTISENISSVIHDTDNISFLLEGLIPFAFYEIRVTAENGVSSQNPVTVNRSATIITMTMEGIPPPVKVTLVNDNIQLSLLRPMYPSGIILYYQVAATKRNKTEYFNLTAVNISLSLVLDEPGTYSVKARAFTAVGAGPYGNTTNITIPAVQQSMDDSSAALIIGVSVGVTGVVLIIAILCCAVSVKKRRDKRTRLMYRRNFDFSSWLNEYKERDNTPSSLEMLPCPYTDGDTPSQTAVNMKIQLSAVIIDYNSLNIAETIAKGKFGVVYKGSYTKDNQAIEVAIKTMKDVSSYTAKEFIDECNLANKFDHPNVLSLIGVSIIPKDAIPLMVMPYMLHGDVKCFLALKRGGSVVFEEFPKGLNHDLLVQMCLDIAKGMEYLSSRRYLHRDLAARNCMLGEDMTVKVADFGLSRDVYVTDYYVLQHSAPLPVKWLAPEVIFDRRFSEKSDVWAYGVTCWEIFSLGLQPYPLLSAFQIGGYLKRGNVLEKPSLSSDEMYDIMKSCWNFTPEGRPGFLLLVKNISEQLERKAKTVM